MKPKTGMINAIIILLSLISCGDKPDNNPNSGKEETSPMFTVRMESSGDALQNPASAVSIWNYGSQWHSVMENAPADYFRNQLPFVKYVQLFAAAGGSRSRDLFQDPLNTSVMDDYNFTPLIRACRNIVRQGLIPYIKLGNVPLKFTKKYKMSADFDVNLLPPDDYRVWHNYIKALAGALADEFGLEQVRTWRFGSVTELENKDWFSVDNDPEKTREAFFKLYDYTADAMQQVLGDNVCIGAHCMANTEGLWDERDFIVHCARGMNYCTGKTGTPLRFLSCTYYEGHPGVLGSGHTLPETIGHLRKTAEEYGLNNLFYGVDEGVILSGTDKKPLLPRLIGYTWQAAYDASIYHTAYDNKIDYISHWGYTTNDCAPGILSVSAQTAGLFYKMTGAHRLPLENSSSDKSIGAIAAWNKGQNKVYLLFYAHSDDVQSTGNQNISCKLTGIEKSGTVTATRTLVSDDSNFYDDWRADWPNLGITQSQFSYWSSDGFIIEQSLFKDRYSHYQSCAVLKPHTERLTIKNGTLDIQTTIPVHGVLLYEIEL